MTRNFDELKKIFLSWVRIQIEQTGNQNVVNLLGRETVMFFKNHHTRLLAHQLHAIGCHIFIVLLIGENYKSWKIPKVNNGANQVMNTRFSQDWYSQSEKDPLCNTKLLWITALDIWEEKNLKVVQSGGMLFPHELNQWYLAMMEKSRIRTSCKREKI